jgi:hypothetical protein
MARSDYGDMYGRKAPEALEHCERQIADLEQELRALLANDD